MGVTDVYTNYQKQKKIEQDFKDEFENFVALSSSLPKRFDVPWEQRYPQLKDKTVTTPFDPHYIYFTAWAMRTVLTYSPQKHIDISSNLYFSTMLSSVIKTDFYDYRPVQLMLSNLDCKAGDLNHLPFNDNQVKSLSCMHVVEHIGLGRYGDPMDPVGDLKSIQELIRVLAPKGNLLFVVPIGKPIIQFNAHRIYSFKQISKYFSPLKLKEFSLVPDDASGGIIKNPSVNYANQQTYGCGCFWFTK